MWHATYPAILFTNRGFSNKILIIRLICAQVKDKSCKSAIVVSKRRKKMELEVFKAVD